VEVLRPNGEWTLRLTFVNRIRLLVAYAPFVVLIGALAMSALAAVCPVDWAAVLGFSFAVASGLLVTRRVRFHVSGDQAEVVNLLRTFRLRTTDVVDVTEHTYRTSNGIVTAALRLVGGRKVPLHAATAAGGAEIDGLLSAVREACAAN